MTSREPGRPQRAREHEVFEELAAGYALHALEPEDELLFTSHLAACAACERAVAEHAEMLGELATALPAEEPPPALLQGILAGIGAPGAAPAPAAPTAAPTDGAPADELAAARRRRAQVAVPRAWLLSGAAAVTALVVALGAWNASLLTERTEQAERADRLAQSVEALERADAQTVRLTDGEGRVLAVVIAGGEDMSMVVDGLHPNSADTVYVLWGQSRSGEVRALSTFDVPRDGLDALHGMRLDVPMGELTALMVTHEPGRTAPDATEQPVVAAGEV
jgi:hypothetical protein